MSNLLNVDLSAMDRRSLFHPLTHIADHDRNGPVIYANASGATIHDQSGRALIDMGAGLWCVNVGYGRPELATVAAEAIRDLSFQHLFGSAASEPVIRLADRLLTLFREKADAPQMSRVFFGTSGSDANDTAVKLVRYYNNLRGLPEKKKIISRMGAYHGVTVASGSLTGIPSYHTAFDLPIADIVHTSCPSYFGFGEAGESEDAYTNRMVGDLEALILAEGPGSIAAFIAEPVMGTGGVLLPPRGYFEKVQALLDRHDILLIVDEVITGFGRTGEWFGTGKYRLKPDIVSLAKGLTSAYFPMSASLVSDRIWSVLRETSDEIGTFMHGFTYSGHPVGAAIALANIDIIENEELPRNAHVMGEHLLGSLRKRIGDHRFVGDIRGAGLMVGIEFVADRSPLRSFATTTAPHKIVAKHAFEQGVLTRALPFRPVNSFSPPLTITRAEVDEAVERYGRALDAATPELEQLITSPAAIGN